MTKPTEVYAVIDGVDYGGEDFNSLKLFFNKEDADKYEDELKESGADYTINSLIEIN